MSYYYNYYLGYKKDGVLYPMGPFDRKGKLACVLWKSRSFASDLHEDFRIADDKQTSIELRESLLSDDTLESCRKANIPYTDEELKELAKFYGNDVNNVPKKELKTYEEALNEHEDIRYLPYEKLPSTNFIKEGYVQYSQIGDEEEDDFYDVISPHEYAERLKIASTLGDIPKKDCEGNEFPRLSEYIYHKWIDYNSREWESFLITNAMENFKDYHVDADEYVIIETEG